jgi:hypothetical protein
MTGALTVSIGCARTALRRLVRQSIVLGNFPIVIGLYFVWFRGSFALAEEVKRSDPRNHTNSDE